MDVTAITTAITAATTAAVAVGTAVIVAYAGLFVFRLIQRVL